MRKHIIILAILAIAILVLPFLIGDKIILLAEKPIETVAPTIKKCFAHVTAKTMSHYHWCYSYYLFKFNPVVS